MAKVRGPKLDLDNIQGNILAGFNKEHQSFIFVRFDELAAAREWLKSIVPEIASTTEVKQFNDLFSAVNRRRGRELGILKATWTNLAVTFRGLEALGVGATDLDSFPEAFRQGMRARAERIGDTGRSAPENWIPPFREDIHAVLLVASDKQDGLHDQVARDLQGISLNGGIHLVFVQEGATRVDQPGDARHASGRRPARRRPVAEQ